MFGTDNIMNNILGNKPKQKGVRDESCYNFNGPRQHLNMVGRGQGLGMNLGSGMNRGSGMNGGLSNPNNVLMKIKGLMDQLPEVKKATGDLKIHLDNGDVIEVKLNYTDRNI